MPEPVLDKTAFLTEGAEDTADDTDAMRQCLTHELHLLNTLLVTALASLQHMANVLRGRLGIGGAQELLRVLPDLQALESRTIPPSWLPSTPCPWRTSSLHTWTLMVQAAHTQLNRWARLGGLRSYYLPVLQAPEAFLTAARVHLSRQVASSRLQVVPLEDSKVCLTPTARMQPSLLPAVVNSAGINVHGLVLQGGVEFEVARSTLKDVDALVTTTEEARLPVMQVTAVSRSAPSPQRDVAFECPLFLGGGSEGDETIAATPHLTR